VLLDIEMEVCSPLQLLYTRWNSRIGDRIWREELTVNQGVKQIKNSGFEARYVFIAPPEPAMKTLEGRLRGRGTESEESIQKRLLQAKNEIDYSKTEGVHDLIIVNDDLEKAYKELESFVFKTKTQDQSAKDPSMAGVSVQD
jgi:guanylate kinase